MSWRFDLSAALGLAIGLVAGALFYQACQWLAVRWNPFA